MSPSTKEIRLSMTLQQPVRASADQEMRRRTEGKRRSNEAEA